MAHITIKPRGQKPQPNPWHADATLFTCPFCTSDVYKPREYHQIMAHLAGHKLRAVEYGAQVIYGCNLGCGEKTRHFHCCECPKMFTNKNHLRIHLCSAHPIAMKPPKSPSKSQPASHPHIIESQQLEDGPQESPAPPVTKRKQISMPCFHGHITVQLRGQEPRPIRWHADATLFTCPFCTSDVYKPRQYHQIMAHIAGHKLRAVKYGDQVMYCCKLGCGEKAKHFHCCQCPKTYSNKEDLKRHLCSTHPVAISTPKLPCQKQEPRPSAEPPSEKTASHLQKPDLKQPKPPQLKLAARREKMKRKQKTADGPYEHVTVKKKGQQPQPNPWHADATLFTCPFCTIDVYKPRQYHQIMTHIAIHKLRAVEYGDQVIYSCKLGCGKKGRHFHCCHCPKSYCLKEDLKKHLSSAHPIATCTPDPQAVSHTLQEPSHLQELDSQQHEPHQLELAEMERKQISVQGPQEHVTVKKKGQEPRPNPWHADATLFTCPFCTSDVYKPRQYHQIMAHIAGHKLRAVEYGDQVIYKCSLGCGEKTRHFHCCQCPKTYINISDLKRHLCRVHPIAPSTPEPQPGSPLSSFSVSPVGSPLQEPSSPLPAPKLSAKIVIRKRIVQCPHCGLNLNSKNLKKHIERKHQTSTHPIASTLPAQCVDKKNGIYVVSESFLEPCTLVHVAKRFWGSTHKVMCEMDICNSRVAMAQRNQLLVRQCLHLSSVDYCCAVAPTEGLSEEVLDQMVDQKWFDNITKNQCLKQQNRAKSEGATFTSLVTIGGSDDMYYISVFEPEVAHYCKLGRVLVNYNAKTNTWHCPCSESGNSCLHISIAKWCLFQMKKQLFKTMPDAEEEIEKELQEADG
ncbi:uncharacterized protein si:ch73-341k19.1 [Danio rerio]|uniref:Uncharacterized protein si:ch73-341k19.1 n=1 Tax=Danio rerio TaxID=7955 RepID=A0A8M2B4U9_DANRE